MSLNIPALDLSCEVEQIWEELETAVLEVLRSTKYVLGPTVSEFEKQMAEYLGVKHAVGVNSGTDALVIGLRSLGVGSGDEVITSPFTFVATAEAVKLIGATPVFVDIEPDTFNLDIAGIASKINSKTKAIVPVHLYGQAADMDPIVDLAAQHNLKVLEDAAQAMGGTYKGKKLGAIGDAGAFSFYPSKNLGAYGDGGMLVTNDDETAACARMLRDHGSQSKYHNVMLGYNSRLDAIQAAILKTKLPHLDGWNQMRKKAAERYNQLLAGIETVATPVQKNYAGHVYHQYTIRLPAGSRDRIQQDMNRAGIATVVYYPVPVHKLPMFEKESTNLPNTEQASGCVLSLPIWPQITPEQQQAVACALSESLARIE